MTRVLTLTSSFPSSRDDISGKFVKELAIELEKRGNSILVLTPHLPGTRKRERIDGLEVRRFRYMIPEKWEKLGESAKLPKVRAEFVSMVLISILFIAELFYCIRLLKRMNVDVIHSHWLLPQGLVGAIARKIVGKPHLMTIHSAGLSALEMLPFRTKIADFIEENSDHITIVSSHGRARFESLLSPRGREKARKKMTILPMGVDATRFELLNKSDIRRKHGIKDEDFLLVFIGRLSEVKGVEFLIKAMRAQKEKKLNSSLIVVGEGPLENMLRSLAESCVLRDRVFFVGKRTGKELDEILVMADAVVVPSIVTETGETEGLPVVVLESFAAGCPVIASNVGGIADVVRHDHTGLLVPPRDPDAISNAIERLMNDRDLCYRLAHNALEDAKSRFSWDSISARFDDLLRSILSRYDQ